MYRKEAWCKTLAGGLGWAGRAVALGGGLARSVGGHLAPLPAHLPSTRLPRKAAASRFTCAGSGGI